MGAVLEPTPAMGRYSTEARGESFYLAAHPGPRFQTRPDGAAVAIGDVPAVLAALDQIRDHLAGTDHQHRQAGEAPRRLP